MMDTRKSIFALFLGWSGATVLLTAYFLTLFGVVDLKIDIYLDFYNILEFVGKIFLFSVNIFVTCLLCDVKKVFVCSISYLPIFILSYAFLGNSLFTTALIPFIYIIILKRNHIKEIKVELFLSFIVAPIYQIITSIIKFKFISIQLIDINFATTFILSIDLFLFYYYIVKVVKVYVGLVKRHSWKHVFLSEIKSIFRHEKTSKESLDTSDLNARQKALFAVLVLGYQLFQMAVVLAIGFINNMFIELLVMLLIFWIGRTILQKSWHSDKLWICSTATFGGFYILTKITPPFEISLFLVVALTGAFIYILHILGVKADRLEELENKELQSKKLNVKNVTIIMQETKVPQKYHDYLLQTIVNNMRDVEWFNLEVNRALNIDENQYRRYKTKFKKVLKSKGLL